MDGNITNLPSVSPLAPAFRTLQLKRAATFTSIAGVVFSILFLISFFLLSGVPIDSKTTDQELIEYYRGDSNRISIVALYLIPFAGIAFLWFVVSLRMWISVRATRAADLLFSNIQLAAGIIYLALFFAAAAAMSVNAVMADFGDVTVDPVFAREFPQFGSSLFYVFAIRMGAMFVFTTMTIGRQAGVLPRWFITCGYILGIFMLLSATFSRGMILAFPIWTLTLCAIIFYYAHGDPDKLERRISRSPFRTRTSVRRT